VPHRESTGSSLPVLEVLERDQEHVELAHENLVIVFWRSAPLAATYHSLYDHAVARARSHPAGRISVVSVLQPGVPRPSATMA